MVRPIGRPEPLRVATSSRLPSSVRVRMLARRAWNWPQSEQDEISRKAFCPGSQTSTS